MGARRSGRESALQMLFQIDASGVSSERAIELFFRHFEADPEGKSYAETIVRGVESAGAGLDQLIEKASNNWRIARMTKVDRNVLRVAAWELAHGDNQPRAVILDEAVELAKTYGSEDSSSFVNGVLQRIADLVSDRSGTRPPRGS